MDSRRFILSIALVIPLVLASGALFAQDDENEAQQIMGAHDAQNSPDGGAQPDTTAAITPGDGVSANSSMAYSNWFGSVVGGIVGIGMGPVGIIGGAVAGGVVERIIDLQCDKSFIEKTAAQPAEQQVNEWKTAIRQRFGIVILDGPEKIGNDAYDGDLDNLYRPSKWSVAQLQAVYETLGVLPESFRSSTKKIVRIAEKTGKVMVLDVDENGDYIKVDGKYKRREVEVAAASSFGVVYDNNPSTVHIFDLVGEGDFASPAKADGKFRAVLVHEMTHCFQNAHPEVRSSWASKFWRHVRRYKVTLPVTIIYSNGAVEKTSLSAENHTQWAYRLSQPGGNHELGQSVSIYGGFDARKATGNRIGSEDMAESTAFAALGRSKMEAAFPGRYDFIEDEILDYGWIEGIGVDSEYATIANSPGDFGFGQNQSIDVKVTPGTTDESGVKGEDNYSMSYTKFAVTDEGFNENKTYIQGLNQMMGSAYSFE